MPLPTPTHSLVLLLVCLLSFSNSIFCSAVHSTPCPFEFSVVISSSAGLDNNGTLLDPYGAISYPNGSYWETIWDTTRRGKGEVEYWGCPCKVGVPCLTKCCPAEEAYKSDSECVRNDVFCPKRTKAPDTLERLLDYLYEGGRFALFSDYYPKGVYLAGPERLFSHCEFHRDSENCTSHTLENLFDDVKYCVLPIGEYERHPWSCESSYSIWFGVRHYVLEYPYGRTIGTLAFCAAFFVYAVIPELRNLHGKMLLSHLSALILADLISVVAIVYSLKVGIEGCLFFAFGIQFFFLASFFWLNIICYDIYSTFKHVSPLSIPQPRQEARKFLLYMLYAWGCPLIILSVTCLLELTPGIPEGVIKPDFRVNICWFYSTVASVLYFLGFSSVLVGCNIFLFILTAYKIYQLKKGTDILTNRQSVMDMESVKKNKQRYDMYVKLLIMMGFLRMVEMVFRLSFHSNKLLPITDYTEGLNGCLSFIIFVWKKDILEQLKRSLCPCIHVNIEGVVLRRRNSKV